MSELIEAACDICGQKYRWSEDRLGKTAMCRECGTNFEVTVYVPPTDDDEVDLNNPLPWIKGAGVAALILLVLTGLGSLLVYRPPDAGNPMLARNGAVGPVVPAAPQREVMPVSQMPATPTAAPAIPRPAAPNPPGMPPTAPPQIPGTPPSPVPNGPPPVAPQQFPPPTNVPSFAAAGTVVIPPVADGSSDVGAAPKVEGWRYSVEQGRTKVHITGDGLSGVILVEELLGIALVKQKHTVVSGKELEFHSLVASSGKPVLVVLHSAMGVTLVFSQDVKTIVAEEDYEPSSANLVCFVRKGGKLKCRKGPIALLEGGAICECEGLLFQSFMQQGAELKCMAINTLYAEPGARLTTRAPGSLPPKVQRVVALCPLPPFDIPRK